MTEKIWTPEDDAKLLAMIAEGVKSAIIAQRFGVSRNAVLGRAFRLRGRHGVPPAPRKVARDDAGWRIPREGTKSRRVYDMLKGGRSPSDVRAELGVNSHALMYFITHPDYRPPQKPVPQPPDQQCAMTLLALPAPRKRHEPTPTPAVIYLPGPPAAPRPPDLRPVRERKHPDFLVLSDIWNMPSLGRHHRQPYHYPEDSPERFRLLEIFRKAQERAWYRGGLTREEIIELFGPWPTQFGHRPYEWSVGYPEDHAQPLS